VRRKDYYKSKEMGGHNGSYIGREGRGSNELKSLDWYSEGKVPYADLG